MNYPEGTRRLARPSLIWSNKLEDGCIIRDRDMINTDSSSAIASLSKGGARATCYIIIRIMAFVSTAASLEGRLEVETISGGLFWGSPFQSIDALTCISRDCFTSALFLGRPHLPAKARRRRITFQSSAKARGEQRSAWPDRAADKAGRINTNFSAS